MRFEGQTSQRHLSCSTWILGMLDHFIRISWVGYHFMGCPEILLVNSGKWTELAVLPNETVISSLQLPKLDRVLHLCPSLLPVALQVNDLWGENAAGCQVATCRYLSVWSQKHRILQDQNISINLEEFYQGRPQGRYFVFD